MLTQWLTRRGFTRDDACWLWSRIVSFAAIVASGVLDLDYWTAYVGLHLSVNQIHLITVVAAAVLWIAGKQDHSKLPPSLSKT